MKSCKIIFSLFSLMALTACMPDSMTKYKVEPKKAEATSSSGGSSGGSTTSTGTDVSTLGYFQVEDVSNVTPSYYLHKYTGTSDATQECKIDNDDLLDDDETALSSVSTGTNDIGCWLEAEESKLYFNGVKFRVNVAPDTCDYVTVSPFYFWQYQPGSTSKVLNKYTCDDASCSALCNAEFTDAQLACVYDYTDSDGPNCDTGSVTINTYTISDTDTSTAGCQAGAPVFSDQTVTDCNGERYNCLAGPGVDFATINNYPTMKYYYAIDGLSEDIEIASPFSKGHSSVRYVSNYTKMCQDSTSVDPYLYLFTDAGGTNGLYQYTRNSSAATTTHGALGFTASQAAIATTAASNYVDDPYKGINPYYEVRCLNFADEVKGRIRIQVRDWNQIFTRPSGVNTWSTLDQVARANHTKLRRQSVNSTDYEGTGLGYWNDFIDWDTDDFYGDGTTPSPSAISCTAGNLTNEGFEFPGAGL